MTDTTWFRSARFGMFLHFGPYAALGHGEQSLFRDRMDQRAYAAAACAWNPVHADPAAWAATAADMGARYAVLTTRHHDGYCLWDTATTDYSSARQAPRRDLVAEYVQGCRAAGVKVGLYHSLADWRLPAYWDAAADPAAWARVRAMIHRQVEELCTRYGAIDMLWFDGAWPRSAAEWDSAGILAMIRRLQPGCLVNNRLDCGIGTGGADGGQGAGASALLGDFGTPEHHITAESRPWESCQTACWRLWGHVHGARWKPTDQLLDLLCECASRGGNLLLNVGPDGDGRLPAPFLERARELGAWLRRNGTAIYGPGAGDLTEMVTYGWQTVRGDELHLILRFWDGSGRIRFCGLESRVLAARLLADGRPLRVVQDGDVVTIDGLPRESPDTLFPVVTLRCDGPPRATAQARERLWNGDPRKLAPWAAARGQGPMVDGSW